MHTDAAYTVALPICACSHCYRRYLHLRGRYAVTPSEFVAMCLEYVRGVCPRRDRVGWGERVFDDE